MRKKTRTIIMALLGIVFIVGIALTVRQMLSYRNAEQARLDALALIQPAATIPGTEEPTEPAAETTAPEALPETTAAPAEPQVPLEEEAKFLLELDLTPLQSVNEDVLGWIHIAGGDVSYPLLRSYDNRDYLYKTWEKKFSNAGSVFLECKNNRNLLDFNTIIYGHHMADGSVFAPIVNYRDPAYLAEHACIYILTGRDLRRYEIFSAYEAALDSSTYRLYFPDEAAKLAALDHFIASSQVQTGIVPTADDYILTLSTCVGNNTYETRWVVQARLTGIWTKQAVSPGREP